MGKANNFFRMETISKELSSRENPKDLVYINGKMESRTKDNSNKALEKVEEKLKNKVQNMKELLVVKKLMAKVVLLSSMAINILVSLKMAKRKAKVLQNKSVKYTQAYGKIINSFKKWNDLTTLISIFLLQNQNLLD